MGEPWGKYEDMLFKMFYFTICVWGKYFLPFEFSSNIVSSIYGIYKLLGKYTDTPHFKRSLFSVTAAVVT